MSAPVSKLKRRLDPTPLAFTQRRPFSAAAHESPLTLAIDRLANKAPKISDEQEDLDATEPPVPPLARDAGRAYLQRTLDAAASDLAWSVATCSIEQRPAVGRELVARRELAAGAPIAWYGGRLLQSQTAQRWDDGDLYVLELPASAGQHTLDAAVHGAPEAPPAGWVPPFHVGAAPFANCASTQRECNAAIDIVPADDELQILTPLWAPLGRLRALPVLYATRRVAAGEPLRWDYFRSAQLKTLAVERSRAI